MQPEKPIAEHPFFGSITSERWNLVFHPPGGRPGVAYTARYSHEPTRDDYDALVSRLSAFEAFCRNIEVNDRIVRDHFRLWPSSAGEFELVWVMMSGGEYPLPWALEPGMYAPDAPQYRPFALQYRALNQDAWDVAGITWHPPLFLALFDEAGIFSGIDHEVEQGMRSLPNSIAPSRWASGYRHPYFGRCELSELERIGTAMVAGRKVPIELFMTKRTMIAFEPEQLDPFVPLAERLHTLDAKVRADFPEEIRHQWLERRFTHGSPALQRAINKVFPGATAPHEVSHQDFVTALLLGSARFSLSPEVLRRRCATESGCGKLSLWPVPVLRPAFVGGKAVLRLSPLQAKVIRLAPFHRKSLMTIRRHNPPTVHSPAGRYSHVTVHPLGNGLKRVVLAGQVGLKLDGAMDGEARAQIEQAWDNVLACLASEKLGPEHLAKIVYFTTVNTPEGLKLSREIRACKLGDIAPSSTFLVIAGLAGPDYKVEIEGEARTVPSRPFRRASAPIASLSEYLAAVDPSFECFSDDPVVPAVLTG